MEAPAPVKGAEHLGRKQRPLDRENVMLSSEPAAEKTLPDARCPMTTRRPQAPSSVLRFFSLLLFLISDNILLKNEKQHDIMNSRNIETAEIRSRGLVRH